MEVLTHQLLWFWALGSFQKWEEAGEEVCADDAVMGRGCERKGRGRQV